MTTVPITGMDIYGKRPTSETGRYFRRNVWVWNRDDVVAFADFLAHCAGFRIL